MDGLTNRQRAAAWLASWNPSFVGKAIVNENFTFLAVNDQFCEILGVTPAILLENSFVDITAEEDKALDMRNAELVIKGLSPGYLMEKSYRFEQHGTLKEVTVLLMVVGVYKEDESFDFFMSRIVEAPKQEQSQDVSASPSDWNPLVWLKDTWKYLTVAIPVIAWVIYEVAKLIAKGDGISL